MHQHFTSYEMSTENTNICKTFLFYIKNPINPKEKNPINDAFLAWFHLLKTTDLHSISAVAEPSTSALPLLSEPVTRLQQWPICHYISFSDVRGVLSPHLNVMRAIYFYNMIWGLFTYIFMIYKCVCSHRCSYQHIRKIYFMITKYNISEESMMTRVSLIQILMFRYLSTTCFWAF